MVSDDGGGNAVVSAIDPQVMFKVVDNPGVEPVAAQVREKLERALEAIKTQ